MNWADLADMLVDVANQPAIVAVCGAMVFVAGLVGGYSARLRCVEEHWPDTGDTQAPMIASAWMPPPTTSTSTPQPQHSEWPARRVRMPPYPLREANCNGPAPYPRPPAPPAPRARSEDTACPQCGATLRKGP